MPQPREIFGATVPAWVRKRVKRWKKIFNLNDWIVRAYVAATDLLTVDEVNVDATNTINAPYQYANMFLGEHVKDNDAGHAVVFHEMRHIVYQKFFGDLIDAIVKQYVPAEQKRHVDVQIASAIESLIENDVYVFEQLTDL